MDSLEQITRLHHENVLRSIHALFPQIPRQRNFEKQLSFTATKPAGFVKNIGRNIIKNITFVDVILPNYGRSFKELMVEGERNKSQITVGLLKN